MLEKITQFLKWACITVVLILALLFGYKIYSTWSGIAAVPSVVYETAKDGVSTGIDKALEWGGVEDVAGKATEKVKDTWNNLFGDATE